MLLKHARKAPALQQAVRHGFVHMTGPGIPPVAASIARRYCGTFASNSQPHEFPEPGPPRLPLLPQDGPQLPTQPLVQRFETRLDLRQLEVCDPSTKGSVLTPR